MTKFNICKKLVFVLIMSSCIFSCKKDKSTTPPPTSDVNLSKGLMLYFPFNGSINDSSGNNNAATVIPSGALGPDRNGNANQAFNGIGDGGRILVSNNGSIHFDTAFTISLDFMVRNDNNQSIISMTDNSTSVGTSFIEETTYGANQNFCFATVDTSSDCNNDGGAFTTLNLSSFVPQPNVWYNAITAFHNGVLTTYINGSSVSSATASESQVFLCAASQVIIGGWWQGGPISINGELDNVRMYNRVLNSDEIDSLSKGF